MVSWCKIYRGKNKKKGAKTMMNKVYYNLITWIRDMDVNKAPSRLQGREKRHLRGMEGA